MREHAQERIGNVDDGKDDRRNDSRNDNQHKHEAGAASRVVFALFANIFNGQFFACFVAENGLVLCAVVLERAANILHM